MSTGYKNLFFVVVEDLRDIVNLLNNFRYEV